MVVVMLCNVGVNAAFSVDKPLILYLLAWLSFLCKLQNPKGSEVLTGLLK